MGLKGTYNYRGITLNDAYARIESTQSVDTNCTLTINVYSSQEARVNNLGRIDQIYPISFTKQLGKNVGDDKTQGYDYIKTLPQFQGWTDVLETGQTA